MSPLLIAHRCGPGVCPEQSMAAARHALSLGADMVEMDVRFTRDGAPVICHDANALRVFGVERLCSDMTLREFTALRHTADAACPAHTLEDVLGSGIRPLLLHCKISGEPLRDIARRVAAHGAEGACVLGVQEVADVDIVRAACPAIRRRSGRAACLTGARATDSLSGLDSLIAIYGDLPEACEIAIKRYQSMSGATNAEKTLYVRQSLAKWGGWKRANVLRNAERELTCPTFDALLPQRVAMSNEAQTIKLNQLRNIETLTMRVYRTKLEGNTDLNPSVEKDYKKI